ncbi:hypothetical protein ACFL31_05260 [Candidatus Margulisiibacteriota bacterium]
MAVIIRKNPIATMRFELSDVKSMTFPEIKAILEKRSDDSFRLKVLQRMFGVAGFGKGVDLSNLHDFIPTSHLSHEANYLAHAIKIVTNGDVSIGQVNDGKFDEAVLRAAHRFLRQKPIFALLPRNIWTYAAAFESAGLLKGRRFNNPVALTEELYKPRRFLLGISSPDSIILPLIVPEKSKFVALLKPDSSAFFPTSCGGFFRLLELAPDAQTEFCVYEVLMPRASAE